MAEKKIELPAGKVLVQIIAELITDKLYKESCDCEEKIEEHKREEVARDDKLKDTKEPNDWGETYEEKAGWDHKDWKHNDTTVNYLNGRKDYADELVEDIYHFLGKLGIE